MTPHAAVRCRCVRDMCAAPTPHLLPSSIPHNCSSACLASACARRWRGAERFTFEHAAQRLLPKASRLTGGEVSTVMWSFATARHVHPGMSFLRDCCVLLPLSCNGLIGLIGR